MTNSEPVAVVGLGYVGLPLALLAAEQGYPTIGIDIDDSKIAKLQAGNSYIGDVSDESVTSSTAEFTTDISRIQQSKIVIICVPTPVTKSKMPDLEPIKNAIKAVAPHLQPGTMLIAESTVNPSVCDSILVPLLESSCDLRVGHELDFVHCPERINPGDSKWDVRTINRVIGGDTPRAVKRGAAFYESIIDADVRQMASLKEAEAVKIIENTFRDINIAFVNELSMSFHKMGISLKSVIDGASTKPFAFMPHYPGTGVGGHCIPVDPYYLIEYARGFGFEHKFLSLARSINEQMPNFTVELLREALDSKGKKLEKIKVGVLGLAYKSGIADDRESPAYAVLKLLEDSSGGVKAFDPHVPGKSTAASLEELLEYADALVLVTAHKEFAEITPGLLKKHGIVALADGRGTFGPIKQELEEAGVAYQGIGQ